MLPGALSKLHLEYRRVNVQYENTGEECQNEFIYNLKGSAVLHLMPIITRLDTGEGCSIWGNKSVYVG